MERKETKERILDAALDLFSDKGYDGVGIDLIAETAGIKGPSVYRHFKGKEDILKNLIIRMEEYYDNQFGSIKEIKIPSSMDELLLLSKKQIGITMHDAMIQKVRKLLILEQFRDASIAELMSKHSVYGIQGMYEQIFKGMQEQQLIINEDVSNLAMEFVLPVTVYIQMYDRQPEKEREIMEQIEKHLQHFANRYGIGGEPCH